MLMGAIALTGNYNFFNLITCGLVLASLDDSTLPSAASLVRFLTALFFKLLDDISLGDCKCKFFQSLVLDYSESFDFCFFKWLLNYQINDERGLWLLEAATKSAHNDPEGTLCLAGVLLLNFVTSSELSTQWKGYWRLQPNQQTMSIQKYNNKLN